MDMPDGMTNTTASTGMMMMMMKPYIHFTPGDFLYFSTWTPTSPGVIFGACFALFMIAILERSVAALTRVAQCRWTNEFYRQERNIQKSLASSVSSQEREKNPVSMEDANACMTHPAPTLRPIAAPFYMHVELQRGILRATGATLAYILMLAVMTFNAGFILSTIIGLGVGDILFGRFGAC